MWPGGLDPFVYWEPRPWRETSSILHLPISPRSPGCRKLMFICWFIHTFLLKVSNNCLSSQSLLPPKDNQLGSAWFPAFLLCSKLFQTLHLCLPGSPCLEFSPSFPQLMKIHPPRPTPDPHLQRSLLSASRCEGWISPHPKVCAASQHLIICPHTLFHKCFLNSPGNRSHVSYTSASTMAPETGLGTQQR